MYLHNIALFCRVDGFYYLQNVELWLPWFAALVASWISVASRENFQSSCVSEKGVVSFGLV